MKSDSFHRSDGPCVGNDITDEVFSGIRDILLEQTGLDLAMYKDQCMKRRIASRIRACGMERCSAYVDRLRRDPDEAEILIETLAIHVSRFFRNPEVFALLEAEVLPPLIKSALQRSDQVLRIWSAGCSGGEEPYSMALLLSELAPPELNVEILASDIGSEVLQQARNGCFDPVRLSEVPQRVLDEYFKPAGSRHQLVESVRRRVRFFDQNLLTGDYPNQVDLILCRNVLIYFSREDQDRILQRFHMSLNKTGMLVLGTTESLFGSARQLFEACYGKERIFRRIP
ncbi:MAG: chemotaxis protein CheR [Desulfuromonas sp.]|nr:MAG: chemotaxis protein CheR [Desulfuromonas sp.]